MSNHGDIPRKLTGKEVGIPRKDVKVYIALDTESNIHLLISPDSSNDKRITKFDLKGLKMLDSEWSIEDQPPQSYLDISCDTGREPAFRRPFLRFAEDVLVEISESGLPPVDAVYRTGLRWKKFWSPDGDREVVRDWLIGLLGELLLLTDLIMLFGPHVVYKWTGPIAKDHDFQVGTDLGIEVKTSTETPFQIHCNLSQLDNTLYRKLFVVCYRLTASETGLILPDLVKQIENLLKEDESCLEKFYDLLKLTGYSPLNESRYADFRFINEKAVVFTVNDDFPKITESSFVNPPDHRVRGIRYQVELTGLPENALDDIVSELNALSHSVKV